MRSLFFLTLVFCSIGSFAQQKQSSFIKERPEPARMVNDFGKFLTKAESDYLEQSLNSFNERKGYSVVIITIPKLSDKSGAQFTIEDAAQRYFNKWQIGDEVKNDGVLILLSKQPRRVQIQTGSGIRTLLTDDDCQNILDSSMAPAFKAGLYFTGLKDAVKEIETVTANNEAANKAQQEAAVADETQQVHTLKNEAPPEENMMSYKIYYGFIVVVIGVWLFISFKRKKAIAGQAAVYSRDGYSTGGNVNADGKVTSNNTVHGGRRKSWGSSSGSSWFSGKGGSW